MQGGLLNIQCEARQVARLCGHDQRISTGRRGAQFSLHYATVFLFHFDTAGNRIAKADAAQTKANVDCVVRHVLVRPVVVFVVVDDDARALLTFSCRAFCR